MVLSADGFLDKRLGHRLAVNQNCVVVLHRELRGRARLVDADANVLLDLLGDAAVDLRSAIAVALETLGSGHADLVKDLEDDAAIPEDLLEGKVVHADGLAKLDVSDWVDEGVSLDSGGGESGNALALSIGKPSEKNEMRKSQTGQLSMSVDVVERHQ